MSTETREPGGRSRFRLLLVVAAVLLLVVWSIASILAVRAAASDLRAARSSLADAEQTLTSGDLGGARAALDDVVTRTVRSSDRLDSWYLQILRPVPLIGVNVETATVISTGARDTALAASDVVDVAIRVVDGGGAGDVGGGLRLTDLNQLGVPLRAFATTLEATTTRVIESPRSGLVQPVATARADYLEMVTPQVTRAMAAADVAEQLPTFIGLTGRRTYLLAAGSLSELRGSGGLIGSFSVMTADAGQLSFEDFVGIDDVERSLRDPQVVPPSASYAARYGSRGGLRFWRNVNQSSDFPSTAQVMLELWEADDRPSLDGIILVDNVAFEELITNAGATEVPGVGTLTADNVRRFVGIDAYAAFDDQEQRKLVLGAVATAAFTEAVELLGSEDLRGAIDVLSSLARGGDLKVYSREPSVQEALVRLGVAGELPRVSGEFGAVVVNNVAANKVDYFTAREVTHRVELLDDGVTAATIDVLFRNEAPTDGLPRYVLGPWTDDSEAGDNLSDVTFLCGPSCQVTREPEGAVDRGMELGRATRDVRIAVPAGEERELTMATRTAQGWHPGPDGRRELVVDHLMQPTVSEDDLAVIVAVPPGFTVQEAPEGASVRGDEVVWNASTRRAVTTLRYVFAPSGNSG